MSEDGRPSVPDTRMSGELQEIADEQRHTASYAGRHKASRTLSP